PAPVQRTPDVAPTGAPALPLPAGQAEEVASAAPSPASDAADATPTVQRQAEAPTALPTIQRAVAAPPAPAPAAAPAAASGLTAPSARSAAPSAAFDSGFTQPATRNPQPAFAPVSLGDQVAYQFGLAPAPGSAAWGVETPDAAPAEVEEAPDIV